MSTQGDFTTALYRVENIYPVTTRMTGVTQYQIVLTAVEAHVRHTIATTISTWHAALCDRAKAIDVPILITYQKTKYGHGIVRATLQDDRPVLDRLMPHDGNFGLSGWVTCQATTCVCPTAAIERWEKNYVDPVTREHWHEECVEAARGIVPALPDVESQLTDGDGPDLGRGTPICNSADREEKPVAVGPARSVR